MSIWAADPGLDTAWPEWFIDYRMAIDAEMHAMIAAVQRGEMTEDDFAAWALEDAERHVRWLDALPPERRAWVEGQEAADRALAQLARAMERSGRPLWPGTPVRGHA